MSVAIVLLFVYDILSEAYFCKSISFAVGIKAFYTIINEKTTYYKNFTKFITAGSMLLFME